jgi:predicted CXXCH cytochrome family protein
MSLTPKPEAEEIKVFISNRNSTCDECHEDLGTKAWITLVRDKGALCLSCGDLDHLVFLASGDAALTRRARKHSLLSAVVLKWSRARRRYERQGLMVEESALDQAEEECLADFDVRQLRREREAARRAGLDSQFVQQFADKTRKLFPRMEAGRELSIAEHACLKYSGRIGRSDMGRRLDEEAVRLAVIAHIRHRETNYDELLGEGWDRSDARDAVAARIDEVLSSWEATRS